jgi:acetyltransferase-like isoleucine patch superfamily enzyme
MSASKSFIAEDAKLSASELGENCKVYHNAEVRKSVLGDFCTVGDDAIILDSRLGDHVAINRRNYLIRADVGRFTYTGTNTAIRSSMVGSFCNISWDVSIGGAEHAQTNVSLGKLHRFLQLDSGFWTPESKALLGKTYENMEPCVVGNDVWIAAGVIVLRGVKIGDGAIIGAGAVVTKDVEPYSIVAGVPARKMKMRFDDATVAALQKIKWWDWPIDVIRANLELLYRTTVDVDVLARLSEINKKIQE